MEKSLTGSQGSEKNDMCKGMETEKFGLTETWNVGKVVGEEIGEAVEEKIIKI